MNPNFLDQYQKEFSVILTPEQIELCDRLHDFSFKKKDKFCYICRAPLTTEDRKRFNVFEDFNFCCHQHAHLSKVINIDAYYHQYGTLELCEQYLADQQKRLEEKLAYESDFYKAQAIQILADGLSVPQVTHEDTPETFYKRYLHWQKSLQTDIKLIPYAGKNTGKPITAANDTILAKAKRFFLSFF